MSSFKLSEASIKRLSDLLAVAGLSGLDRVVINQTIIRGIDDKKSVLLIQPNDGSIDLGGASMSLGRLGTLASMVSLIRGRDEKVIIEANLNADETEVVSLKIIGSGAKAEFRCAAAVTGDSIPRALNSVPVWEFPIMSEVVGQVIAAASALGADRVGVMYKAGEVSFECQYSNTDSIVTSVTSDIRWLPEDDTPQSSFYHILPCKSFFPLLKAVASANDVANINVGSAGVVTLMVKGFQMYVLPVRGQ